MPGILTSLRTQEAPAPLPATESAGLGDVEQVAEEAPGQPGRMGEPAAGASGGWWGSRPRPGRWKREEEDLQAALPLDGGCWGLPLTLRGSPRGIPWRKPCLPLGQALRGLSCGAGPLHRAACAEEHADLPPGGQGKRGWEHNGASGGGAALGPRVARRGGSEAADSRSSSAAAAQPPAAAPDSAPASAASSPSKGFPPPMPPFPKRCSARLLRGLLGCLAALAALGFLAAGGHEELLSRSLPFLLRARGAGEALAAARPPLPAAAFFALSPPACAPPAEAPGLLVLVASAPAHAGRREAVRASWGAAREAGGLSVRLLFVLGLPGEAALQAALEREAAEHGDVLQGRFVDTYANLTLKTLALLGWSAARCPAARFVLKADDDVFLNLPALARHLRSLARPEAAYLGRVHWRVAPVRDPASRHYVPASLYAPAAFPPYCSGTAYVLSGPAAAAVLAAARHLPLVPVEDVFVGLCARRAGLAPRHLARMAGSDRYPPDACCYREVLYSAHGVTPALMLAMAAREERPCSAWQRRLGLPRCRALLWLAGAAEDDRPTAGSPRDAAALGRRRERGARPGLRISRPSAFPAPLGG